MMPSPRYSQKANCSYDENPTEQQKDAGELHLWRIHHERCSNDKADEDLEVVSNCRAGQAGEKDLCPLRQDEGNRRETNQVQPGE